MLKNKNIRFFVTHKEDVYKFITSKITYLNEDKKENKKLKNKLKEEEKENK
jgi:hypothetical protein